MSILKYNTKTPNIPEVEAAIYDLLTGEATLRSVGDRLDRSHQGVYILALNTTKKWVQDGKLKFTFEPKTIKDFK